MAERERSRDRPSGHQPSSSASGAGPFAFINNLLSSRGTKGKTTTGAATRGPSEESATRKVPFSAAPVDLETAIRALVNDEGRPSSELCEILKAITVYVGNKEDVFAPDTKAAMTPAQVQTLYARAAGFAERTSEATLRTAAIRLIAVLLISLPLSQINANQEVMMTDIINTRSLYRVIISPTSRPLAEEVAVEVEAVKALTANGTELNGMDGIVGWVVRSIEQIGEEWTAWCRVKDGEELDGIPEQGERPLGSLDKRATPADTIIVIIDLLISIITSHAPLFTPDDLDRIVQPILDIFWSGVTASTTPFDGYPILSARLSRSPLPSAFNSPAAPSLTGLGLESSVHREVARKETASTRNTPNPPRAARQASTSSANPSPRLTTSPASHSSAPVPINVVPRWTSALPALCHLLQMTIEETVLSTEVFEQIVVFVCLCCGQDDVDSMPGSGWEATMQLLDTVLDSRSGRRGELCVRNILEGNAAKGSRSRLPDIDRKVARGAVM